MSAVWPASQQLKDILNTIKDKNHPHLLTANIAFGFNDTKPFIHERFNWGKASKFNKFAKLWQDLKYDFCIILCSDVWHDILNDEQREALLDLHLSRCTVEYEPEIVEINGKKKPVKDEYGRTKYTDQIKVDDEGDPKWKVDPLDLYVILKNAKRYGLWFDNIINVKESLNIN